MIRQRFGRNTVRERDVERRLVEAVRSHGGLAIKFISPGWDGAPDRIILFPGKRLAFVELKRPGGKMRPIQLRRKSILEKFGFRVYCIDQTEMIGEVLNEILSA